MVAVVDLRIFCGVEVLITFRFRWSPFGVVVSLLDCDIVVASFKSSLSFTFTYLEKGILPAMK